jgi:hypothetical protein
MLTNKQKIYYEKKYSYLNLYFNSNNGWSDLTLLAAITLDTLCWPKWMPNWLKRLWGYSMGTGYRSTKFSMFLYNIKALRPITYLPVKFTQIKEKFGGLCLYTLTSPPDIIHQIESLSYETCQACGSTHNVGRTNGWISTYCKDCFDKTPQQNNIFHSEWKPNKT